MSSPFYLEDNATETNVIELEIEELEQVIAPRLSANHNATLAGDEVELSVEEIA